MAEIPSLRPCSGKIRFSDYKYHVYLSIRVPDVRKSLVDHLFQALSAAGIHAFLDNERLEKGEIIGLSLVKAIENSAILIPIFSSGYADSCWCLEEVRQMWKCSSTRLIIPLFYGVDPSCVRYPLKDKGKYAEAFNNHYSKGRFEKHRIDEWKDALHYISSLSGWSLDKTAGYAFAIALFSSPPQSEALRIPEIFQPLKISYDSLLPSEKEIFLDIVCVFVGQDMEEPAIFWEELGLDVDTALHNLQQKLLIKIDSDNQFAMHDLLRDLGRAIVADESPGNPGKRSRLWKQEDVQKVINEKRGTENVKYLIHTRECERTKLKKKSLASMNGLRYICFDGTILMEGDTSKLSPDLKWLKWNWCPLEVLPPQWNLEHLAILDLSSRSISHGSDLEFSLKQLWNEQSHRKMPKNLRVLRVNWCPNLQRLPPFSIQKSLVKSDLTGCSLITELPDSLGFQAQLYYLELSCCSRLEKLPDCIGNLLELKHLGLAQCSSLKALPHSIGFLQKLQYLNLFQCEKLEQLPSSITKLSCLQKLILSSCSNLNKLPDILEGLKSLKILELKDVFDMEDLPLSIGSLSWLEKLDLESCLIVTLPPSVGHLKHLRCINMNRCELLCLLPDEIGGLESLEELLLNECENLTKIPSSFPKLQSLVRFEAGYCDLKSIPKSFGELSSLKILHLEHNKFSTLPSSFAVLSQLTELILYECTELIELPILPEGLVKLDIDGCIKLKSLPKLAHLKRMQMLRFARCSNIVHWNVLWEV